MEDKINKIKKIKSFVTFLGFISFIIAALIHGDSINIFELIELYFVLWLCSSFIIIDLGIIVMIPGSFLYEKYIVTGSGTDTEMLSLNESYTVVFIMLTILSALYIILITAQKIAQRKKDREIIVSREFTSNDSSTTYAHSNVIVQDNNAQSGMFIDEKHSDGSNI